MDLCVMEINVHALIKYCQTFRAVNILTQNKTGIKYNAFYVKHIGVCLVYEICCIDKVNLT